MTGSSGKGGNAVRASRRPRLSDGAPWQKYEFFPTPPWATRALVEIVLPRAGVDTYRLGRIWEPCAGMGHMADVLAEYSPFHVFRSDVHDYSADDGEELVFRLNGVGDFLDPRCWLVGADWIITNPPFRPAAKMLARALVEAQIGVAFLLRLQWLETIGRYADVFLPTPPTLVAPFVERVPMCEGGWDPNCDTATAYAWFVWVREDMGHGGRWRKPARTGPGDLDLSLIPPCKTRLTRPDDRDRFAGLHVPGWVPPSAVKKRA